VDWFGVNLYCNDPEIIKKRLEKRGDKEEEISRRIKADKIDFEGIDYYSNMDMCNDGSNKPEVLAKVIDETYERFLIDG
jgi:guanylate kinase